MLLLATRGLRVELAMMQRTSVDYAYTHGGKTYEHDYWVRPALAILPKQQHRRLFDLGCGNGAIAADLQSAGFDVMGSMLPSLESPTRTSLTRR